ncbi:bifunctional 5,10-methylene-tetrahydrofolate dehydrogenase/5,10-methylene-tetrahydrofolate cyclohydrolase [Candidatus Micrarchaeota archaeon CG1_02_47_40]|nr:MAG: bifunctional 5,10-methylene-tetrahydrofolate dehydrogenase/5,10-methylene-tetrahydrofolate cyclohydrolase [Candidatus Micrarchaeota archaeon CG1_02_47_40]
MAELLEGKKAADKIIAEVSEAVKREKCNLILAVVLVGDDKASELYVKKKEEACLKAGIASIKRILPADTQEEKLLSMIRGLNENPLVGAILVQVPLPEHISEKRVMREISPQKDVDCFHPENTAKLYEGDFELAPCTPRGIMDLIGEYGISLEGKHVVIVGRSNAVGKPLALMMLAKNATVTVAHSKTKNLAEHTKMADILVCAVGKRNLITADMVKEGVIVIDAGIVREGGKVYGDVEFEGVSKKASRITPVPGGVGPMTIAGLMKNTLILYERKKKWI